MAILTDDQLARLRQIAAGDFTVNYDKQTINIAFQVMENFLEGSRDLFYGAVDQATAPYMFTDIQKEKMFAWWVIERSLDR